MRTGSYPGIIFWTVGLMAAALSGCREKSADSQKKPVERRALGSQFAATVNDEAVLKEANAAVNEVIRNTDDCEALRAAVPEAQHQLDIAEGRVKTGTGRQMIGALRNRLRNAQEFCP